MEFVNAPAPDGSLPLPWWSSIIGKAARTKNGHGDWASVS